MANWYTDSMAGSENLEASAEQNTKKINFQERKNGIRRKRNAGENERTTTFNRVENKSRYILLAIIICY